MCTAFFTAAMSSALGVVPPTSSCAHSSSRPAPPFSAATADSTLSTQPSTSTLTVRLVARASDSALYSWDLPFGMVIHCQSLARMRARMMICPQWLAMCESERVSCGVNGELADPACTTVRSRSASVSGASASFKAAQPVSQSACASARVNGPSANSPSRSRHGFSPSDVRKSVKRDMRLPPMCRIEHRDRVAVLREDPIEIVVVADLRDRFFGGEAPAAYSSTKSVMYMATWVSYLALPVLPSTPAARMDFHATAVFPRGFRCASRNCGLKPAAKDLALFVSDVDAAAAAVFTRNQFPGRAGHPRPRDDSRRRASRDRRQQQVQQRRDGSRRHRERAAHGGRRGRRGRHDGRSRARELDRRDRRAACRSRSSSAAFAACPRDLQRRPARRRRRDHDDRHVRQGAVRRRVGDATITWVAKGSGMIEPNMATMLAYIFTDAAFDAADARPRCCATRCDVSFNMLSVDSDTSTSDTCAILANGLAGAVDRARVHRGADRRLHPDDGDAGARRRGRRASDPRDGARRGERRRGAARREVARQLAAREDDGARRRSERRPTA